MIYKINAILVEEIWICHLSDISTRKNVYIAENVRHINELGDIAQRSR